MESVHHYFSLLYGLTKGELLEPFTSNENVHIFMISQPCHAYDSNYVFHFCFKSLVGFLN